VTDGSGPAGATVGAIRARLRDQGTSDDDLDRAEADGTPALLAVERLLVPETARCDLAAVTEQTGMTVEQVQHLWRSLGFPVPRPGEVAFTDSDVEILAEVGQLVADDVASADLLVQMSRVIGSSGARIASARVDVIGAGSAGSTRAEPGAPVVLRRRGAGGGPVRRPPPRPARRRAGPRLADRRKGA
jgi:hypothetical protein